MSSLPTERSFIARRAARFAFAPILAASAIACAATVDPRVLDSASREGSVDTILVLADQARPMLAPLRADGDPRIRRHTLVAALRARAEASQPGLRQWFAARGIAHRDFWIVNLIQAQLPASALSKRFAFRHASLTQLGRSAALLIGTQSAAGNDLLITITASTPRPIQLRFERAPSAIELRRAIDERIPADGYFDDVHGSAAYKRHLTRYFAEQIRAELMQAGART